MRVGGASGFVGKVYVAWDLSFLYALYNINLFLPSSLPFSSFLPSLFSPTLSNPAVLRACSTSLLRDLSWRDSGVCCAGNQSGVCSVEDKILILCITSSTLKHLSQALGISHDRPPRKKLWPSVQWSGKIVNVSKYFDRPINYRKVLSLSVICYAKSVIMDSSMR